MDTPNLTRNRPMKIGVIGLGHVGLPTSAALAHWGHKVVGTDTDLEKITTLNEGRLPFFEPQLAELVHRGLTEGNLTITEDVNEVVAGADVVFLCVGTPPKDDGDADLRALEQSTRTVAAHATGHVVVVCKSTVPAGTCDNIARTLSRFNGGLTFDVVSNPEFMREGSAVEDSLKPSRIVVGVATESAASAMRDVYRKAIEAGTPFMQTDIRSAELAKHASNAFLATKISYANALARICEAIGADVTAVVDIMGGDPRIGRSFLDAGLGYGGFCFPKDLACFEQVAAKAGYDFGLLREVAAINAEAIDTVVEHVKEAVWNLDGKRIALLGLSFKPGTSDIRSSPSIALANRLLEQGADIIGYDPAAATNVRTNTRLTVVDDAYEALKDAHCVIIGTDWPQFIDFDWNVIHDRMAHPVVVDARNLLDASMMVAAGFTYIPVGKR